MSGVIAERLSELESRALRSGSHATGEEMCVMEAVAYVAGEKWSDSPACACPIISSFLRSWNDGLPSDSERSRLLKPLVPQLVGSKRTKAIESKRAWMFLDWSARVSTPAWLELAGIKDQAEICRRLQPLTNSATARLAQTELDAARAAAGAAAWAAAWDAAGDAARDAARAAAGDALDPTVQMLQQSALELIDRMLEVT